MFLFSCAYAYAYVACVMLIAQVGTRLYSFYVEIKTANGWFLKRSRQLQLKTFIRFEFFLGVLFTLFLKCNTGWPGGWLNLGKHKQ